jgi:photosystem II stability/assembly factor-like uncharacterized protein
MILMPRLTTLLLAAAALLPAQQQVNNGKPMRISAECKQDDLQSLGLSCSEDEPCPAYLELGAVEAVGSRIFLAGNIHTSTVTLSSILLASADDGKTWTEPYDRIRFAALEQIQFIDFQYGWISAAIIQTLPRDPFFLLTSDGGKTWHNRPLFDEPHNGSIEHFSFDSRNTGALLLTPIGHSYEMYESTTGGESWSLKQVSSKQLNHKHTRTPVAS